MWWLLCELEFDLLFVFVVWLFRCSICVLNNIVVVVYGLLLFVVYLLCLFTCWCLGFDWRDLC